MPVLVDGDLALYDSTVIIEYLEDTFPAHPLFPKEPSARARCRLLELEADEVLLVPVRAFMHRSEPPGPDTARRVEQERVATNAEDTISDHYAALTVKLGDQEFLCGDFSVADIVTFMVVHHGLRLGGPPLVDHQNLSAWYARLAKHASFAAVMAEMAEADKELSHPVPAYCKTL